MEHMFLVTYFNISLIMCMVFLVIIIVHKSRRQNQGNDKEEINYSLIFSIWYPTGLIVLLLALSRDEIIYRTIFGMWWAIGLILLIRVLSKEN